MLSCEVQLARLGAGNFDHWLASCRFAFCSSFTQLLIDWSTERPVVAATMLGSQRMGAIVVIERQIGLRNYIEGGISLDATLTYALLVSIFQRASPLHDGAVIVQHDRVAAAGCFLPLTVDPQLSRTLGTRHRAAIGLTEENDAVAIVVSEETGHVSLALDGRIEQALGPDRLRSRLQQLLRSPRREPEAREARAV